jgi:hypothetical protein
MMVSGGAAVLRQNRFKSPTPAGFRDVNINLLLSESLHVAEVQASHR